MSHSTPEHHSTPMANSKIPPAHKTAIARAAHEAIRAYSVSIGDDSYEHWEHTSEWQSDDLLRKIDRLLAGETSDQMHKIWRDSKIERGWVWGPVMDLDKKTHPDLVPYDELPIERKHKDLLLSIITLTMSSILRVM